MMKPIATACLSLGLCIFAVAAGADNREPPIPPLNWQSENQRNHPLVGRIWSVEKNDFVTVRELGREMALARFVLLGEVHDNPDHHLWQAWAIRTISKLRGSRIVEGAPQVDIIAMEMVRVDQNAALDKFYGRDVLVPRPRKPRDFARMLKWDKSGWPDFKIYAPIIEQALYEQIVIVPASVSRNFTRRLSKEGEAALADGELSRLSLATPLPETQTTALSKEILDSHCGLIPESAVPRMSFIQRFRDATMADSLLAVATGKGGILIAGNGHVRRDRGVPWYLEERGVPADAIVSLKQVEVNGDSTDPADYVEREADGRPVADYIVFTPRKERPDPCAEMRAQMDKMRAKRTKE